VHKTGDSQPKDVRDDRSALDDHEDHEKNWNDADDRVC